MFENNSSCFFLRGKWRSRRLNRDLGISDFGGSGVGEKVEEIKVLILYKGF